MQFHERVKLLRERKQLTQKEMADILDVAKSTYIKYERGEREPRQGTLVAISQYFDVSIDFLLGSTDEENQYVEQISELSTVVTSEDFRKVHKGNTRSAQKMIADYIRIASLTEYSDLYLDLLYPLVKIGNTMLELSKQSRHLFCYKKWAEEDPEYKDVVLEPTLDDMGDFLNNIGLLREVLDDFIATMSSEEYHLSYKLHYAKEIAAYSQIDYAKLIEQFHDDLRYKI